MVLRNLVYPVPVAAVIRGALAFGATDEVFVFVWVVQCGLVSSCSESVTTEWFASEFSDPRRVEDAQFRHRPNVAFSTFPVVVEVVMLEVFLTSAFKSTNGVVEVLSVLVDSEDSVRLPR